MSLLVGYYQAMNEENSAKAQEAMANAGLIRANANEVAPNAAAQRAESGARQAQDLAGANRNQQEAGQVAPNAAAQRGLQGAQAGNLNTTSLLAPGIAGSENALRASQAGLNDVTAKVGSQGLDEEGFAKGTGKVGSRAQSIQGKGPKAGPTDTVPAMLTPGEAVLNKGAAEHYGTDVIDHMNKMGLMRMAAQSEVAQHLGMPDPHAKAKGKDEQGNKKMGKDGKPAVKTDIPGFAKGGMVPTLPHLDMVMPPSGKGLLHGMVAKA